MKTYVFRVAGKQYQVEIEGPVAAEFTVVVNGKAYSVSRETLSAPAPAPVVDRTETAAPPLVRSAPASPALAQPVPAGGVETIGAPLPGKILSVAVAVGSTVHRGDELCILEAMKMESAIRSPADGQVQQVHVEAGASVQYNDPLVTITKTAG